MTKEDLSELLDDLMVAGPEATSGGIVFCFHCLEKEGSEHADSCAWTKAYRFLNKEEYEEPVGEKDAPSVEDDAWLIPELLNE